MNARTTLFRIGLLVSVAVVSAFAHSQPTKAWSKSIGLTATGNNSPDIVKTDSSGNVFVAKTRLDKGTTGNFGFVEVSKMTPAGTTSWTVSLLGQGTGLGRAIGLVVDAAGNPIVMQLDNLSALIGGSPIVTKLSGATGGKTWSSIVSSLSFSPCVMANDVSGNVFVGGQARGLVDARMAVTRLNGVTGSTTWTRTVSRTAAHSSDWFSDLAVDSSGNVALVGTARPTDTCNSTAANPFVIARIRGSDGAPTWVTTYNNLAGDKVRLPRVGVDSTGNVYVGGSAIHSLKGAWIFSKRAAGTGSALWSKALTSGATTLSTLSDLAVDGTGGFAGGGDASTAVNYGFYAYKFTSSGATSWDRFLVNRIPAQFLPTLPFGQPSRRLVAVGSTSYLCGASQDTNGGGGNTCIAIVDRLNVTNGVVVWEKTFNGAASSRTVSVSLAAAPNGDACLGCSVETGSVFSPIDQTGVLRLASANGAKLNSSVLSNGSVSSPDFGSKVVVDSAGNVYSVGGSLGRVVTAKYNSAGTQLWKNVYDSTTQGTSGETQGGRLILLDGSNNVIVAGNNRGQIAVLKLNNSTGVSMWTRQILGTLGRNMALNSTGDVFVPDEAHSTLDKVNGSTGTLSWSAFFSGSGNNESINYVAVDSAGHVFGCGTTTNQQPCPDDNEDKILVERLNPANGTKVWSKEVTPFHIGHNQPCGIGVDSSGNLLVGGTGAGVSSLDFTAVKLNPSTGAVIWNTHFDESGKDQQASAMLVDSAGNLMISGTSTGASSQDAWTVKVLGSTGAKSWSNLLTTTPLGNKWVDDLARDAANNIYVGGLVFDGSAAQQFTVKLAAQTGVPSWIVQNPSALGAVGGAGVGLAVSTSNQLHIVGANIGAGAAMADFTIVKYNP